MSNNIIYIIYIIYKHVSMYVDTINARLTVWL